MFNSVSVALLLKQVVDCSTKKLSKLNNIQLIGFYVF